MNFYAVLLLTSLPIEQIMESVHHLVTQHAAKQSADWSDISFTVQLAATEPKLRVFQGPFKRHKIKTGVIWLKDLCQLCELSLHTSFFSHTKKVFKQQRGSAIGNQISPSLANIAVSYLEHQWHQKHKDALEKHSDELYVVRSVESTDLYSAVSIWQTDGSCKSFLQISSTDILWNLRMSPMENSLAPFWTPTQEHSHFNNQLLVFSVVPSDLQALKHISFQLLLPEYAWQADTLFQINKPDLMYSSC